MTCLEINFGQGLNNDLLHQNHLKKDRYNDIMKRIPMQDINGEAGCPCIAAYNSPGNPYLSFHGLNKARIALMQNKVALNKVVRDQYTLRLFLETENVLKNISLKINTRIQLPIGKQNT